MNIKEAKLEISNTLKVYHEKDENGDYLYPLVRQRPILLMGPPGIGKTAIMEQIAKENQVGLVSYTITHHTRQSAVGLPRIREKSYDGIQTSVTEYTMSEIIDSVYACMERTGKREGILFIDEINCASETLAPTMLQFLQNKTFGSHKVPEGWMIVAAGNPPEYNKSVREFDIVTLDRVREIDIDVDVEIWLEYAAKARIHGAILSYLTLKKDKFYLVENKADGKFFVTARGWEDLSELLKSYERMDMDISEKQMIQFLQKESIAQDFSDYYLLYRKYGQDYAAEKIIRGELAGEQLQRKIVLAQNGSFEERFIVTELFLSYLQNSFLSWEQMEEKRQLLYQMLIQYRNIYQTTAFSDYILDAEKRFQVRLDAELLTGKEAKTEKWVLRKLRQYDLFLKQEHISDLQKGYERIREYFEEEVQKRKEEQQQQKDWLDHAFAFIAECFGDEQEMLLFITRLSADEATMHFISEHGSGAFFQYSEHLMFRRKKDALLSACLEVEKND